MFYLQVKKLRDLEREKDLLLMGLQALEQVRYRLLAHPEDIRTTTEELQGNFRNGEIRKVGQKVIVCIQYTNLLVFTLVCLL